MYYARTGIENETRQTNNRYNNLIVYLPANNFSCRSLVGHRNKNGCDGANSFSNIKIIGISTGAAPLCCIRIL